LNYIYLHGFASGPGSTKARYFRERFDESGRALTVPELAEGDFERLTLSGQLAVVERAVGGGPAALIGSSMGGYLAALYAARHAEVERLVLMAPAFGFARRWPESLGAAKVAEWRRTGWMQTFHWGEKRFRRLSYALLEDGAQYEDYPDFRQPALIFHGSRDEAVPVRYSEEFAAAHPNARLRVFDSGHELLDVMEPIWAESREFLFGEA
jgi:uncharacterized protein